MPRVALTPVHHIPLADIEWPGDEWYAFVDHVDVAACPAHWPLGHVVIFEVTKGTPERLMTPDAHFYGRRAHGMLVQHDRLGGTAKLATVANGPARDLRKLTVMLCRSDGGLLPERSDQMYPTSTRVNVPVSLDTFTRFRPAQWVTLVPDPLRDGVYIEGDPVRADAEDAVHLCAERTLRRHEEPDGTVIKYGIRGAVLRHKIVRPPLSRDAGYHTLPGALPRDRALPEVHGRALRVRTRKYVLPRHDFRIAGQAVRVVRLTKTGFEAYRLYDGAERGSFAPKR